MGDRAERPQRDCWTRAELALAVQSLPDERCETCPDESLRCVPQTDDWAGVAPCLRLRLLVPVGFSSCPPRCSCCLHSLCHLPCHSLCPLDVSLLQSKFTHSEICVLLCALA